MNTQEKIGFIQRQKKCKPTKINGRTRSYVTSE